nr:hypothetical protein [Helicobacter pylori]
MPLPFILGGLALAAAGYGFKKVLMQATLLMKLIIVIKKANDLKEEAIKKAEPVESDCKNALMRLGEKKFHVQSYSMSSFVKEFNQLKGCEFVVKVADMQDLRKQVSNAQNLFSQLNTNGMTDESIIEKMLIGYGRLGVSNFTAGAIMVGGMAVVGDLLAAPALAILGL